MPDRLVGQLIGSLRQIRFVPAAGTASDRARQRPRAAAVAAAQPACIIEIETKAGRYAHLVADDATGMVWLCAGAAQPPVDLNANRQWTDLSAEAPAAFDGRPVITAITAMDSVTGDSPGHAARAARAARAWRLDLSTGAALAIRWSAAGPQLDCSPQSRGELLPPSGPPSGRRPGADDGPGSPAS